MSRDTLLVVTTSYPERRDGSEAAGAFVAELVVQLARYLPVRVVAPGRTTGWDAPGGNVRVMRFSSPGKPLSLLSPFRPWDWYPIVRTLASLRSTTLEADRDGRIVHVLALWVLPSGWAAAALQRKSGIPYSVWALGSDVWSLGRLPVVRGILRRCMRGAEARFADGIRLAADAEAIAGVPVEFLASTRQVVPLDSPGPRQFPCRMVFLGRWHPNKGIDLLFDALDQLDDATWQRIASIHIAGGGPMGALVQRRVETLRSQGRPVELSGFLDGPAAAAAISSADWLLIPSRIESIPLIFSDAMKHGRPVVTMPVGDLRGLVESGVPCGIVAASVTAEAFAEAIVRATTAQPDAYDAGIRAAAAKFDLDRIAGRILSAIGQRGEGDFAG